MYSLTNFNLLLTLLLTGLTAGLCFTWTNAVTPGIGKLDDYNFLSAFQQMNRSIINPSFLLVFFGPLVGHIINVYVNRFTLDKSFWLYVTAAILYLTGLVIVTITKNVPLNELLESTDLTQASQQELSWLRRQFEKPWNTWHNIRTLTSTLSFLLLALGMLLKNNA
ncbi:DUF1772 domain-containing protein [Gilvibacter sp.]|uniref:anthrone oxygenase family protein n=1 Tax=Gilvibacter sp. TaxID=2729997 RepID=UPI0025B950A8|nr:DUF1772 domain-containing protein [Gilvibacter sp.]NQX77947.1 DUF1772 domain-containing protein [Gilvibacter sp.]